MWPLTKINVICLIYDWLRLGRQCDEIWRTGFFYEWIYWMAEFLISLINWQFSHTHNRSMTLCYSFYVQLLLVSQNFVLFNYCMILRKSKGSLFTVKVIWKILRLCPISLPNCVCGCARKTRKLFAGTLLFYCYLSLVYISGILQLVNGLLI